MISYYLMMDVGGTGIKCGILDEEGSLLGGIETFLAKSKEGREEIYRNFVDIMKLMGSNLPVDSVICGVGMAFPGPFDYEHGISLMRGLDKYDAIYGDSIREEILQRISREKSLSRIGECPFLFLHDVEAFALGEGRFGEVSDCGRFFCLCIGTGAGSAFVDQGKTVKTGEGVPAQGWIYNTPFLEGIIDDYISVRGLKKLAEEEFAKAPEGAQLYCLAETGDKRARRVYERFGANVLAAVKPFLQQFNPEGLVLGGRISRSYPYFGAELREYCRREKILVYLTEDTSVRALQGLYVKFQTLLRQ